MENFKVYKASAGTGKTFTLVQEYLKLALKNPLAFHHILAVTFTNKAANEMKRRVLSELYALSTNFSNSKMGVCLLHETNLTEKEIIDKADSVFHNILHNYSNFAISTIDSFVQKLSRTFSHDLKLPSQYEVLIEEKELIDLTVEMLFDKVGRDDYITEILTNFIIFRLDNQDNWQIDASLKSVITELLKEDSYQALKSKEHLDKNTFKETKKYLYKQIQSFETKLVSFTDDFYRIIKEHNIGNNIPGKSTGILSFMKKIERLEIKKALSNQTEKYRNGEWIGKKPSPLIEPLRYDFQNIINQLFNFIDENYSNYALCKKLCLEIYTHSLHEVFLSLMEEIIEDENFVHLSEFNKRISNSLQDSSVPYIYERLGERYNNLLIDEFQDTSILQWHNFLPLIENSLSNNNLSLIVGDGKQAIYRFRSGEIEQFLRLPYIFKKELSENLNNTETTLRQQYDDYQLNINYRSEKEIVEFNNDFFSKITSNENFKSVLDVYKDIEVKAKCDSRGFIHLEFVNSKDDQKPTADDFNSKILSTVNQLTEDGYAFNDIAILVRSNEIGSKVVNYLSSNQIPVVSADSLLLKTSPKVQLLIHALSYIYSSSNVITITGLIYFSSLVHKLQEKEYFSCNEVFQKAKDVIENRTSIEKVLGLNDNDLSPMFASSYSLFDVCENLIRLFELNSEADPYVQFFLDMIFAWQTGHPKGLKDFLEFWEEKGNSKSIVISESTNAVKVMSIHKAKGLEFPIVIYPFANGNLDNSNLTRKNFWCDLSDENIPHIQTVMLPITKEWMEHTKYYNYYTDEKSKSLLDNLNILYVAMTRPKKQLYVFIDGSKSDSKSDSKSGSKSGSKSEKCVFKTYLKEKSPIDANKKIYQFGEYKINFDKKQKGDIEQVKTIISSNWTRRINVSPDPTMLWDKDAQLLSSEWGKLVHAIFSEITHINDAENTILKYIIEGCIDKEKGELLLQQFYNFSKNPLISEAFSNKAIIKTESEILTTFGEILRPDRFAELQDRIILIDYKTGLKNESHFMQLTKYKEAIKTMFSKPIDAFLVYLGEKVEIQMLN